MVEDLLQKLTPKQFFSIIGGLIAAGIVTSLLIAATLVATNFNILNWME